ncbi:MAG: Hpt domain-containing protein, partial [Planctomycetales bacterium]
VPENPAVDELADADELLYDLSRIRDAASGDEEFVVELIEIFISDTSELAGELETAIDRSSADPLKRCAHSIKGMAATMGSETLRETAYQVEQLAATEDFETARRLFNPFQSQLSSVHQALERFLQTKNI